MSHRSKTAFLFVLAVFAVALYTAPAALAQEGLKIGVVNLDQVLVESNVGKALQAKLDEFTSGVQTEGESKTEVALELRKQIADGANTLSEDRLAELQQQYEAAATEIRRYRDDKQREGQKMQQEGLADIERRLDPIFRAIREEGDYDLILNYAPGVVVILSDRVNITAQVVERLNAATAE